MISRMSAVTVPAGPVSDLLAQPLLGSAGWPAMEVVAADAALQQPTRHTGMEVAAQEVETLATITEVNDLRLVRVQLKAESGQDRSRPDERRLGLRVGRHRTDEVIRIADEHPVGRPPTAGRARGARCWPGAGR